MDSFTLLLTSFAAAVPPDVSTQLPIEARPPAEPVLNLSRRNFTLPIVDYRAPDGTWKHGNGIIVGRDIAPNATVGIGFFKFKPKSDENSRAPLARKSSKVSLGFSLRF